MTDLSISKSGPASVGSNGALSYTIVLSNAGPAAGDGALFRDPAVANLTVSAVSCGAATGGAVCPTAANTTVALLQGTGIVVPTLPSGGSVTFTVSGTAAVSGSIANTATVSAPAGLTDPNPGNNSATANTTILVPPTLAKAFSPATIAAGGVSTLTITLSNNNATAASLSAALSDTLPAGVTVAATPNASTTCGGSGAVGAVAGAGSISLPATRTIPGGAPGSCTVTVDVTSATPGTVTNTLAAGALQTSNGANAAAAQANLTVTASSISGTVFNDVNGMTDNLVNGTGTNAGSTTLTVYLARNGLVVAAATVAANGTYSLPTVANGTYNLILSNVAGLAAGSPAPTASLPAGWVHTGEGLVPAGDGTPDGVIGNVVVSGANITGANFGIEQPPTAGGTTLPTEPNPGGTTSIAVGGAAFTTGSSDPAPGTIISYLITGFPSNATSITISGTTYSAATFPLSGVSVPAANIGTAVSVDPLDGPVTVTIPFKAVDNANIASPNTGSAVLPFSNAVADLILQKNGPATVAAGASINYTLTVSNIGPSAVTGATVADLVPAQVTALSVNCGNETGGASCGPASNFSFSGNSLNASVASLPAGSSVALTISGTVAPSANGSFTNTATVNPPAGTTDPNPGNNASSVTSGIGVVPSQADLTITKTGTSTVQVNGAITYQVTVVNAGPGPADGAVVADNVPSSIAAVTTTCSASGGALCPATIASGNAVSVVIPRMPAGGRIVLTIAGTAPSTAQNITNTASVAPPAGITDPTPSNNTASANTAVTNVPPAVADLAVVKTGPASIGPGGMVTYTVVVTNNGPAAADGATLTDALPPVLTSPAASWVAAGAAACGAVNIAGNTLTSTITALPVGGRLTFTITATAPQSGSFSNSATIAPPAGVNDPNTSNNTGGPVVTQIQTTGVAGFVWKDSNRNGVRDGGEPLLPGVTVRLYNAAGQLLGTATTDANGAYVFTGLPAGSGYRVVFDFGNLERGIVVPQNTNTQLNGQAINQTTIDNITLQGGVVTINQNARVVDPSGVLYDSVARTPIAGATVTLIGPNGQPVPANQLQPGTPNNQVTGADGSYMFLLLPSAPTGTYTIQVTPPSGYAQPIAVLGGVAQPTPVNVPPLPGSLLVQAQSTPPQGNAPTTYHLTLNGFGPGAQDVVNNHIPLDPAAQGSVLINKIASTNVVELGDSLKYTVRINNTTTGVLSGAVLRDMLPAGFRYIAGTARFNAAPIADPAGAPGPSLSFALPPLIPNQTGELTYYLRVGVGAMQGDGTNRAQLYVGNAPRSNLAAAKVQVRGGVLGDEACIIGKVFVDCNGDHVQGNVGGSNELGIPGVRIVMETGAYAITDSEGKYSICPVTPMTHVLRVDPRTMPKGSRLLPSSNRNAGDGSSLFADVFKGDLFRADFIEGSCSPQVLDQVKARRAQGHVTVPETERPDSPSWRNQGSGNPFQPQQILPQPRQQNPQPADEGGAK